MKVCLICNKEFKPKRSTAMYCTPECKKQAAKIKGAERRGAQIIKDCPVCGKWFEIGKDGAKTKYCSDECFREARRIENRDRWRRANPGWDDGRSKVCEECGLNFIDNSNTKHAKFCSSACSQRAYYKEHSERQTRDEYKKDLEQQKESTQKRKTAERQAKIITKECAECGMHFKTLNNKVLTCSPECSKSRGNRLSWMRNSKRLNDGNIVDRDISLKVLYKRDKGICYICGDPCDYDDYTVDENNNFTSGYKYPSIDHLIPIVRGGKHAWDNVRLAHHYCNSVKSDSLPEDIKNLIPEDAYILARKVSPNKKKIIQLSRRGEMIQAFDSTFEAERITGIKAKGIQKCARQECKTYGGYVWGYS